MGGIMKTQAKEKAQANRRFAAHFVIHWLHGFIGFG
jgi:hypothetical protein